MAQYSTTLYADNTLKRITICSHFHIEFESTYYNYKIDTFIFIFGKYIKPYMKDIYHPAFIQEWKLNPDIAVYLQKIDKREILLPK